MSSNDGVIAGGSSRVAHERQPATVVLVSGGVDSTVLLYRLVRQARTAERQVHPLFIDYAQRAAPLEYEAADWHCRRLRLKLFRLDLSRVGEAFRRPQSMKLHIPLPHRNLVVLSLALSYVALVGANALALGVIRDDVDRYPSASLPFLRVFRELALTLAPTSFETPLLDWSKDRVVAEGALLGVDFEHTYSCMLGRRLHCGHCTQCRRRDAALSELRRLARAGP
jgi:7-cyano-7-deazaguanine synthase